MELIEKLCDMIEDELHDAEKYAMCALKYKTEYPELADTFIGLSGEEMRHKNMLHDQVERIIGKYREKNGEPPEGMKALYEYLHRKQIEHAKAVKGYQEMYRE